MNSTNQNFEYKIEIPKKLFDVYERTDKENISIWIYGFFHKGERIVLVHYQGDQGRSGSLQIGEMSKNKR